MTHSPVRFQVDPTSVPSLPCWMEEVAVFAHILTQRGILSALQAHVQFARARFGIYDTIDFVIVLLSYALSGEPTLKAFYERLAPFQDEVAALFGRHRLPSRSALSRFLAALDEPTVEALRTQFLHDLLERAAPFESPGGVWDRREQQYVVIDVDGTRQPARQRALPHLPTLPEPHRRLTEVAAAGYTGRKRGEVVRTRTTILQTHTHQWLGTFGGSGNGNLRADLHRACQLASSYATSQQLLASQILLRLDGAYGDSAVLNDVLARGLGVIARSRDYALLGRPEVVAVLSRPPATQSLSQESAMIRNLYDCPSLRLTRKGPVVRVVIATHTPTDAPPKVGQQRNGVVYELFVSTVQAPAMSANDLLDLYQHRGSFETVLADEDSEQDPDRWCSHTPWGQEWWQILSQWVWNLRQECGQQCSPTPLRTTTFASAKALAPVSDPVESPQARVENPVTPARRPAQVSEAVWDSDLSYGPPQWAHPSFTGGFPGSAFLPQADGTLRCPAGKVLTLIEYRQERAKSVRVSYSADLADCRCCHLRESCQNRRTHRARRVSAVYWPLSSPPPPAPPPPPAASPILWRDWPRCSIRRQWVKIVRSQSVTISREPAQVPASDPDLSSLLLTRAQRAHWRLSWEHRLAHNARRASSTSLMITLHGLPAAFAQVYGFELERYNAL